MESAAHWKITEDAKNKTPGTTTNPGRPAPNKSKPVTNKEWMGDIQSADTIIQFMNRRGYQ